MRNISVFVILIHFPFLATGFLRRIQNTSESYLLFIHYWIVLWCCYAFYIKQKICAFFMCHLFCHDWIVIARVHSTRTNWYLKLRQFLFYLSTEMVGQWVHSGTTIWYCCTILIWWKKIDLSFMSLCNREPFSHNRIIHIQLEHRRVNV